MSLIRNAFSRLHYPVDIIAQCVRWYLAYSLSLRNLEEIMAERGIVIDHSTLHRWVKSGANTAALTILNADKPEEEIITVRQNKYLNNLVEQDHLNIKRRIRPMLGFKSFRRAQTILAGIELIHMIRKGQYQPPKNEGLSPAEQFYLLAA
ncbi:DDE-type integrase/transposase/recombinase [Yersinia sp. 2544 StPb PI]|uniref:DDE-type integrase/transposase/recombinase n=1 Tax=Yersinia sp. 2544 StPb PI TaxID=3117409 RepID=UPI003B27C82B